MVQIAWTLTAVAVAHLVTDGLDDVIVAKTTHHLNDNWTNLVTPSGRVCVGDHLILGGFVDPTTAPTRITSEHGRCVAKDACRWTVIVCNTDATRSIRNPKTGLRDGGVGAIVGGERHV